MNAVTTTEARAIQAPALETADPTKNLILVPLSRLVLRPTGRNVRKTPRMSISGFLQFRLCASVLLRMRWFACRCLRTDARMHGCTDMVRRFCASAQKRIRASSASWGFRP
ncbi:MULTISPECIES: hypothetical protein [Pseudomonas]|uniref:hypothetical protein n=1 Tax=Pseudomonas TaxID=286 RepID=UPI0009BD28A1|nr:MULTISPECIES: hypothetical protein [Pseudomonas]WIN10086.1 hypothetical protein QQF68_03865 [Pseudomonas syringae pv. antirrhini str. 126]